MCGASQRNAAAKVTDSTPLSRPGPAAFPASFANPHGQPSHLQRRSAAPLTSQCRSAESGPSWRAEGGELTGLVGTGASAARLAVWSLGETGQPPAGAKLDDAVFIIWLFQCC